MSYASGRGYRAEHYVEMFLQERGVACYRPRAGRQADVGDLGGVPIVVSIKDHVSVSLGTWTTDLQRMVNASDAETGVVWHKRKGSTDPRRWYVTTTGELFLPFYDAYSEVRGCPKR